MELITAQAAVTINAPIEKVWAAMLDTDKYHTWNTFVINVEKNGDVATPGTKMKFTVKWSNGKLETSDETIAVVKPPYTDDKGVKSAEWNYTFTGLLHDLNLVRGTRLQTLEQLPDGTTLYSTYEEFKGLLNIFVPLAKVQDGFERHAQSLKIYAER
jgi:hypothetical protein